MTKHTPELIEKLRWYETRSNNGRGRITGNTRKLLDAGLVKKVDTSFYGWCISITDAGRATIAKVRGNPN